MLENLKNELLGKEISFLELNNYMVSKGFYSVWDDEITEYIKQDREVTFTRTKTNDAEIQIFFNITIDNEEGEAKEAFYMEITSIKQY